MAGRLIGVVRGGEYLRVDPASGDAEHGAPVKDLMGDYFKGIAPSDLGRLDNRQLFLASQRLYDGISADNGTREELAHANEAYAECVRERYRRRATIR